MAHKGIFILLIVLVMIIGLLMSYIIIDTIQLSKKGHSWSYPYRSITDVERARKNPFITMPDQVWVDPDFYAIMDKSYK